jgi:hypothetical protein
MRNIQFRQEGEADAQVLGGLFLGETTNGRQGQAHFGHD